MNGHFQLRMRILKICSCKLLFPPGAVIQKWIDLLSTKVTLDQPVMFPASTALV